MLIILYGWRELVVSCPEFYYSTRRSARSSSFSCNGGILSSYRSSNIILLWKLIAFQIASKRIARIYCLSPSTEEGIQLLS